jgi:hypothetical protein
MMKAPRNGGCLQLPEDVMRKIKRFDPLSVMRIAAICYGAMGLVEGALLSVVFLAVPFPDTGPHPLPSFFRPLFSGFAIVFFPLLLGCVGAIGGGLSAVIYNVSAHYVGGIQVEVE